MGERTGVLADGSRTSRPNRTDGSGLPDLKLDRQPDDEGRVMRRVIATAVGIVLTLCTLVTSAPAQYGRGGGKGLFWVECDVTTQERAIDPIMAFGGTAVSGARGLQRVLGADFL